jgi:hypothetical protein
LPTTDADPERARLQRERLRASQPVDECDWIGLLMGLAAVIGVIAAIIGGAHVYLRLVG